MATPETPDSEIVRAPHPPLTGYYGSVEDRRGWVRRMFDDTAADYDRIERLIGFGSGSRYRRDALSRAGLRREMQVLDVGVGTGLVASQAALIVGDPACVTGLDPSPGMLRNAHVPAGIRLVEGYAENIPYPDASFDFVSMGYALRHIADLSVAFREFFRVLRPGGRLCILEITRPDNAFHAALSNTTCAAWCPGWRAWRRGRPTHRFCGVTTGTPSTPARRPAPCCIRSRVPASRDVHRHVELKIFSEYLAQKPAN